MRTILWKLGRILSCHQDSYYKSSGAKIEPLSNPPFALRLDDGLPLVQIESSLFPPDEHIRIFLSSSTKQMDKMLSRANQGLLSTAVRVDQLWDRHCMSWIEVRRLEIELGQGGDHDCAYTWSLPPEVAPVLAWITLLARRERGEFES